MTKTDDFSKNHRIQSDEDRSLNEDTLQMFIEQFGEEQAIGYMKAVRHFALDLEFAIFDLRPESTDGGRPVGRVRNNVLKLLLHKENFLKSVNEKKVIGLTQQPE